MSYLRRRQLKPKKTIIEIIDGARSIIDPNTLTTSMIAITLTSIPLSGTVFDGVDPTDGIDTEVFLQQYQPFLPLI